MWGNHSNESNPHVILYTYLSYYYSQLTIFIILFYVHQTLAQNVGTGILIIKRPSGRNWRPFQDRCLHPPFPCCSTSSWFPHLSRLPTDFVHCEPYHVVPLIHYRNIGLVHSQGLLLDIIYSH